MSTILVNNIKDTGNNTLLTSDGSGNVTASSSLASSVQSVGGLSNQGFAMYGTSAVTLNSWATTKIPLAGNYYDSDGGVDTTNSKYTVPSGLGGTWVIGGDVDMQYNVGSFHIGLFINGSYEYSSVNNWLDFGTVGGGSRTILTPLVAGDYIELYALHGSSSTSTNPGAPTRNKLWGIRLIT